MMKKSVIFFAILVGSWICDSQTAGIVNTTSSPQQNQTDEEINYLPLVLNLREDVIPEPTPTLPPQGTPTPLPVGGGWPMVAANPERTSWIGDEVSGDLHVEWYRPIEAYISQNTQLIASNGLIYVSTARGLYTLNAADGELMWRFDTELPLGNSPTVVDGVVYVGGYDRKIHALEANSGQYLWSFAEAKAGFDTNPLVINGMVIAGNRDGYLYAIGAHGSDKQGELIWKHETGGPVHLSAAYKDGAIYFAANDNHAYALKADDGSLIWKSFEKLPGDGFHSYWPVIFQDKVIFSAASSYRENLDPGTLTLSQVTIYDVERDDLFYDLPDGSLIGPEVPNQDWAQGNTVIDVSRITEYTEYNPNNQDSYSHKPWRRAYIVLNLEDGSEYTFDSDQDGYPEFIPVTFWGTRSGNRFPPIVGPDGILYQSNIQQKGYIPGGRVMGWKIGTQFMSLVGGLSAIDEPQALSGGGNIIYRNLCCDRVGDWFGITIPTRRGSLWNYNNPLTQLAPGYDEMWWGIDPTAGYARLVGNYGEKNGIYHNHGDQNPIIPYLGRLYVHRSNAIIAYGTGQQRGKLHVLPVNPVVDDVDPLSESELVNRLEKEVQKIIAAGHLRPGYYNGGQFNGRYSFLSDYFDNPGDTLYTLARAYPYVSTQLQAQIKTYLKNEFNTYFDPDMYVTIGWAEGAAREAMPLPEDIEDSLTGSQPGHAVHIRLTWSYPPHNFYAMWKYAELFPEDVVNIYALAKSKVQVPVPAAATDESFLQHPFVHNAYISGYIGFLNLQEMAVKSTQDGQLRESVINELDRLLQLRADNFTKDTYWIIDENTPSSGGDYHYRTLNIARNFIWMVPELADYLNQHALLKVQEAIDEYNFIAPYWFVTRYNAVVDEGVMQNLYDSPAVFQAMAYILDEPRGNLTKYLDVPAFQVGDLFHIQNLIAAIEAKS